MKNIQIIFLAFMCVLVSGCATLFKGYEDSVRLIGAPEGIRAMTSEGIELQVVEKKTGKIEVIRDEKGNLKAAHRGVEKRIHLRSNREHTLTLQYGEKKKTVTVYPKIGIGWAILDLFFGGLPMVYDMYTGNWNHFDDIDATFE